jgi:hypothetical protein
MMCSKCRYFVHNACRRYPPSGRPSSWPTVLPTEWCGEYTAILSVNASTAETNTKSPVSVSIEPASDTAKSVQEKLNRLRKEKASIL